MWIVLFALRYRYTIGVFAILILLFGVLAGRRMSTDILPRVESPEITVVWSYSGLNATEMAAKVTSFSEIATLNNVDDLVEARSETFNGVALVKLKFQPYADINTALAQVTGVSQTILRRMPAGTTPPLIIRTSPSSVPIIQLVISSDSMTGGQLFDFARINLRAQIQSIPGLRLSLPYGGAARQVATLSRVFEVPGHTEPAEEAKIFCRATGTVRERKVDIGDQVKTGDILAIIDAPEIDKQVEAAEAAVDVAAAQARIARSNSKRSATLLKSRAVSSEEAEQLTSTAEQAEAALRLTKAELGRLIAVQGFASIRAPFDATVVARKIDHGVQVRGDSATAEAWLFHLVRINLLRVVIEAAPNLALRLANGHAATVRFDELPGKSFPVNVSRSSQQIDRASGTMRVELLLKNDDRTLPAGLTGMVSFTLEPIAETYLLPTNALLNCSGKSLVALADQGKVKFIEVSQGRNLGENVEVTSAALAGTSVIVSPNAMLREGDAVEAIALPPKGKP
jgi:membrane fusion protein, multidrug efflux system